MRVCEWWYYCSLALESLLLSFLLSFTSLSNPHLSHHAPYRQIVKVHLVEIALFHGLGELLHLLLLQDLSAYDLRLGSGHAKEYVKAGGPQSVTLQGLAYGH